MNSFTYTRATNQGTAIQAVTGDAEKRFSMHAFGAQFCEVRVDLDLGEVRVSRFVGAFGAGRILNPKMARSQLSGGIIWGIGMALMEKTHMDHNFGGYVNANLGEYHVPVNTDIPNIETILVAEKDPYVNPISVKGIGEIGVVGAVAAVANAVLSRHGQAYPRVAHHAG